MVSVPRKRTSWSVKLVDTLTTYLVAGGALATIAAILLVVFVLFGTVFPLFQSSKLDDWNVIPLPAEFERRGVDESGTVMWGLCADGTITVVELNSGIVLAEYPLDTASERITCSAVSVDRKRLTLGFSDGSIRTTQVEFDTRLIPESRLEIPSGTVGQFAKDSVLYFRHDEFSWRQISLRSPKWSSARHLAKEPIHRLDIVQAIGINRLSTRNSEFALASTAGKLLFAKIDEQENLFSGEVDEQIITSSEVLHPRNQTKIPLQVVLLNGAQDALVIWESGTIDRFEIENDKLAFKESASAVVGAERITAAIPMLGRQLVVLGTEQGKLQSWQVSKAEEAESNPVQSNSAILSASSLLLTHEINAFDSSVRVLASAVREHLLFANAGSPDPLKVFQLTTESLAVSQELPFENKETCFSADGRRLICFGDSQVASSRSVFMHPQASWRGYVGSVWYQGHDAPEYLWQPSGGGANTESKLSLVPLLFGTLKATVFAMLVGIPLAIGAAIYSNAFLTGPSRSRIKPVMELMANFPGVIIGYVVASILAPVLSERLTEVLLFVFFLPLAFYYSGLVWNFLPQRVISRLGKFQLQFLILALVPAILLSISATPWFDNALFNGDLQNWLGNRAGDAFGGWFCILFPSLLLLFGALAVACGRASFASTSPESRRWIALRTMLAATLGVIAIAAVATALASFLSNLGWDVRDSFTTGYQDGNALLLGLALGFFVVPIIYTVADDALQAVPNHLREASAACGATPWQTTVRIVLPAAASGLVSAMMLGIGRAAGETMIVLMVAGNTPILDWSPFSGLRTLSATLAIELPKASKGATHFHTLFLAALFLFVITLAANWMAELIRSRFRKRVQSL